MIYQLFLDIMFVPLRLKITSANSQDFKEMKHIVSLVTITHLCLSRSALCLHSADRKKKWQGFKIEADNAQALSVRIRG